MRLSSSEDIRDSRCAQNDINASNLTGGIVSYARVAVNLALFSVVLAGCGGDSDQGRPLPEKTKSFDEIIADAHCLACHLPNNKMGVPSWKDIATKYRKEKSDAANAHLANKITRGGSGAWGRMSMPPYPELNEADLKVVVRGILASGSGKTTAKSDRAAQKK